ncbi:hypothetical protein G159_02070 [Planococcus glaciei CHR43]|uniref:restriction endonuclease subunit S n=1 Tax=Planococcus glaciei TaxID=459472 RepID=UPI0003DF06F2|nr:restriction endonuclease subunit S [Planococcus glaciei]ETP70337.1 hypothetical protein G159_02070 [Planococcus glaciei CHR43]
MNVPQLRFDGFSGDWEIKRIKDVATVTSSKRVYLGDYVNNGIPFYRGKEITELKSGKIPKDLLYISNDKYNEFKTKFGAPIKGDILVTAVGTIGNSMLVENNEDFYFKDGNLIWLREINQDSKFLLYVFSNPSGYKKLLDSASGSNQKALTIVGLNKLEYKMPKVEEQNKIASFFSLIDQKIQRQQEKIEKLEQFKKGMMQKIFSQQLRFKDEEDGEFPEWEVQALSKFTKRVVRKNKGIQSTRPLTISAQQGLVDQKEFFNKNVASANTEGYYILKNGEFAYNKSYSNGYPWGAIKRLDNYEDGVLSTLYICFEPLANVDSDFLSIYFESTFWYKEVSLISGEGARNHGLLNIGVNDFFETKHKMPSIKEQRKIAGTLMQLNKKVEKEKEKLMVLKEQKKGFMQGMFV